MEMLTSTRYLGNTLRQWLIAAAIIIITVLAAKLVYWLFGTAVRRVTSRTKNRLDDILVDMLEEPVTFTLVVLGTWYAISSLTLSDTVSRWVATGYYFVIIGTIAWFLVRVLDGFITSHLMPRIEDGDTPLDEQMLMLIRKGLKLTIWTVAVVVALNNAGYNLGAVVAGLGIGGLALSLAAKDTLANMFGGLTIFLDKPFRLKERVSLDGYDGVVEGIGIRSTRIRTLEGRLVTIPNKRITENVVVNISSEPGRKVVLSIGLTYDMDHEKIQQALALLEEIARQTEGVDPDRIVTAFTGFGDFSLNVQLIYWIRKDADIFGVQTALNLKVLEAFPANGLDMAFPTQTIYTIPAAP